eukprot:607210-Amphidinium_carterae.4
MEESEGGPIRSRARIVIDAKTDLPNLMKNGVESEIASNCVLKDSGIFNGIVGEERKGWIVVVQSELDNFHSESREAI